MTINLKVIDISHHNDGPAGGAIDFTAIAAFGVVGVIHKSSQGVRMVDKMYAARRQAALDAGLLWGAYHFATGDSVWEQVDHFLQSARPDNATLMALDHEPNNGNELDLDDAQHFLEQARDQLGRQLVLYSGNLIKEQIGNNMSEFFGGHRLWLAHYNDKPKWPPAWAKPWLHQFSGDGVNNHGIRVPGVNRLIAGEIDMNSFDGSDDDLKTEWAS